jgi:AraC-like DNA-binding protein
MSQVFRIDPDTFRRLDASRDLIADRACDVVTLDDAAREACLSPFHFHRLFRQTFSETPHEFMVRRRMEQARKLLAQTDLSVSEVCVEVGYQSLGSFSTLFRREAGCAPTEYRRQLRSVFATPVPWLWKPVPACFMFMQMGPDDFRKFREGIRG